MCCPSAAVPVPLRRPAAGAPGSAKTAPVEDPRTDRFAMSACRPHRDRERVVQPLAVERMGKRGVREGAWGPEPREGGREHVSNANSKLLLYCNA